MGESLQAGEYLATTGLKAGALLRLEDCLCGKLDVRRLHRLPPGVLGELGRLPRNLEADVFEDNAEFDRRVVADSLGARLLDETVDCSQTELGLGHADYFESYAVNY